MSRPTLTLEEIARHNVPAFPLSRDISGWEVDSKGNVSSFIVIPAGSRAVTLYADDCRALLARYGQDRGVADFILPDGRHLTLFFKPSEAARALPQECPRWEWDVPSQRDVEPA
jgi:hypothetical protein